MIQFFLIDSMPDAAYGYEFIFNPNNSYKNDPFKRVIQCQINVLVIKCIKKVIFVLDFLNIYLCVCVYRYRLYILRLHYIMKSDVNFIIFPRKIIRSKDIPLINKHCFCN